MNHRRILIIALGAGAIAAPLRSFAQQQGKVWRVGFLGQRDRSSFASHFEAFKVKMRELGYLEGKNLVFEFRSADGNYDRLPGLAAELVRLAMDAIVAVGPNAIGALQKASATIPIVMASAGDPVSSGFVKSLAHPGGNITGVSTQVSELGPKLLEMLQSIVPKLSRVAVLVNSANRGGVAQLERIQSVAQKARVVLLRVDARDAQEIEKAFSAMTSWKAGGVIVVRDGFFIQQSRQIAVLAAKNRLPSIAPIREYAESGGLMSYGQDIADGFRLAAVYVDKIFKGLKPGDLPVEQPTKFELIINGKTAKTLGLKIPQTLLVLADTVIE
jgi:putative ABC transport system substrate-binding protein